MKTTPYDRLPKVPRFHLTSLSVHEGQSLPRPHRSAQGDGGGQDLSPQLEWKATPAGTCSWAVTLFDPDAAGPDGFWHWVVLDLPPAITLLPAGAGTPGSKILPAGAWQLANDSGRDGYLGAAPPPHTGRHRFIFAVHALDVRSLGLDNDAQPADLLPHLEVHTIARASLVCWAEH